MFTRSESTMFRAVHSVHFITVLLGESVSFSRKIISLSCLNNRWLSKTQGSLLKFLVHSLQPTSPQFIYSETPPYGHLVISAKMTIHFLVKKPLLIQSPHYYGQIFWPIVDCINRVPLYLFYFQVFFNQSLIPDPGFPVNLEVLFITIIIFFQPLK